MGKDTYTKLIKQHRLHYSLGRDITLARQAINRYQFHQALELVPHQLAAELGQRLAHSPIDVLRLHQRVT